MKKIGQDLIKIKKKYDTIKVDYDKLKKDYDKLKEEHEYKTEKQIDYLHGEVKHFMEIAEETQKENNFYKKHTDKLSQLCKNLEDENYKLKDENDKLNTENKNLLQKIEIDQTKTEKLNKTINYLNILIQNPSVNLLNKNNSYNLKIDIYDPKNNQKIFSLEEIQNRMNEYYNSGLHYYQEFEKQNEIIQDLQKDYNNLQNQDGQENSGINTINISIYDKFHNMNLTRQEDIQKGFDNLYQLSLNTQQNIEIFQGQLEDLQEEMEIQYIKA